LRIDSDVGGGASQQHRLLPRQLAVLEILKHVAGCGVSAS